MRRLCFLLTLLLLAQASWAEKPWYYPRSASKKYVNPYLTPTRAVKGKWSHRFEGQLVLWTGRVHKVKSTQPQSLVLKTQAGKVPVRFSRRVKNLQADRTGAGVAIKGFVRRSNGSVYLEGRSVIPWSPPGGYTTDRSVIAQWVDFTRPELAKATRKKIYRAIQREAKKQKFDPLFLTALIQVESGFDPKAVSVSGALGLGQLMPSTAAGLGVNPRDIEDNVRGCARMIGGLVHRYAHRWDGNALALASYNAGPNLVARIQRVPHYEQTVNYVYFIGSLHAELSKQEKRRRKLASRKGQTVKE